MRGSLGQQPPGPNGDGGTGINWLKVAAFIASVAFLLPVLWLTKSVEAMTVAAAALYTLLSWLSDGQVAVK